MIYWSLIIPAEKKDLQHPIWQPFGGNCNVFWGGREIPPPKRCLEYTLLFAQHCATPKGADAGAGVGTTTDAKISKNSLFCYWRQKVNSQNHRPIGYLPDIVQLLSDFTEFTEAAKVHSNDVGVGLSSKRKPSKSAKHKSMLIFKK